MERITADQAYMEMASILGKRSTCIDKQVGCMLVSRDNVILATGYNGAPRGMSHCIDVGTCIKDMSGNVNLCRSAHAEQNALIQCIQPGLIHTAYCTLSPCSTCVKLLMNTSCKRIIFNQEHAHTEAKDMWPGEWSQYGRDLRGHQEIPS